MSTGTKRFVMFSRQRLLAVVVLSLLAAFGYRQWGWKLTTKPAEYRLPFVGAVKARMRTENVTVKRKDAPSLVFPMQVYYNSEGHLFHAEFVKPGVPDYRLPVDVLEDRLKQILEKHTGLPTQPLKIGLSTILENTGLDLEKATHIEVNYVNLSANEKPAKPTVTVNVFGVHSLVNFRGPDYGEFLRVRTVMDPQGKIMWGDNSL